MDKNFESMMELISEEGHNKLSCGLGPQSYINGIHVARFCSTGLLEFIKDQIGACETCAQTKMLMRGNSTLAQAMKTLYLDEPQSHSPEPHTHQKRLSQRHLCQRGNT